MRKRGHVSTNICGLEPHVHEYVNQVDQVHGRLATKSTLVLSLSRYPLEFQIATDSNTSQDLGAGD